MNKTIKQMADIMGINKLRIYRFIYKKDIKSSKTINGSKTYDKTAQKLIYKNFGYENNDYTKNSDNNDDKNIIEEKNEFINFIKDEIEEKNAQIDNLQKMLDQQQQLSLQDKQTISDQKKKLQNLIDSQDVTDDDKTKVPWWHFWH